MNTFLDIFQCLQEISVTDHKKKNTKEKIILWHANRHMYTYWKDRVSGEDLVGSRD